MLRSKRLFCRQAGGLQDPQAQGLGLLPVHPAGGGGQIQEKGLGIHPVQPPAVQHPGRDGIDNELEPAQFAGEIFQADALVIIGRRPGQILIAAGRHGHPGPQGPHSMGGEFPHPAEAQHQDPGAVEGEW